MAELDKLVVKIEADLKDLKKGLSQASASVSKSSNKMTKSMGQIQASAGKLQSGLAKLAVVFAAGLAGKKIADTSANFEDLQLTLNTVFKTAEAGEAAMGFITTFAQRTPFDIETLTKSFIQLGGAGIKPTEKLLTTLGDAASATTNRMQTFEALTRIVTRATGGGLGLEELEQLVSAGLPVYKILQDEIGVTRTEISEMGQSAEGANKIMDALLTGLDKEFGGGMQRASGNLSVAFSNLGIAGTDLLKIFGDQFNDSLTDLANTMSRFLNAIQPVTKALGFLFDILIMILEKALLGITIILERINALFSFLDRVAKKLSNSLFGTNFEIKENNDSLKEMEEKLGKNIKGMDMSVNAAKKLEEQLKKNVETQKDFNDQQLESMRLLEEMSLEPLRLELEQTEANTEEIIGIFDSAGDSIAQAFGDSIASGESFRQSMLDIFQSVISSIVALIVKLVILEPILERIRKAIKGTQGEGIGSQIFAAGKAIFGFAGGGTVQPNTPIMVGERGAEMFVPNTGGKIIPNDRLASGGQPIVVEQNLNFAVGVTDTVRTEILNLLPAIQQSTLSAVQDARVRGGRFAKDFGA